jgi:uncharacterized membrane protein
MSEQSEDRPNPAEENIRAIARLEEAALSARSAATRMSDAITTWAGSGTSIVLHLIWFGGWLVFNTGLVTRTPFDPFPFSLLTAIVSLEAIFLTLFVLASQNRLTRETDKRANLDLQVNLLSEEEMTVVLRMLKELCEHFNLTATARSEIFRRLIQRTDVGDLAERVERNLPSEQIQDRRK